MSRLIALPLFLLAACIDVGDPTPVTSTTSQDLCNQNRDNCPNFPIQPIKDKTNATANTQIQVQAQPVVARGALLCSGDSNQTTCGISVELSNCRIDARCHEQVNDPGIWCESRVCDASGCTPWHPA